MNSKLQTLTLGGWHDAHVCINIKQTHLEHTCLNIFWESK